MVRQLVEEWIFWQYIMHTELKGKTNKNKVIENQ